MNNFQKMITALIRRTVTPNSRDKIHFKVLQTNNVSKKKIIFITLVSNNMKNNVSKLKSQISKNARNSIKNMRQGKQK